MPRWKSSPKKREFDGLIKCDQTVHFRSTVKALASSLCSKVKQDHQVESQWIRHYHRNLQAKIWNFCIIQWISGPTKRIVNSKITQSTCNSRICLGPISMTTDIWRARSGGGDLWSRKGAFPRNHKIIVYRQFRLWLEFMEERLRGCLAPLVLSRSWLVSELLIRQHQSTIDIQDTVRIKVICFIQELPS